MRELLVVSFTKALSLWQSNVHWMSWNLFLGLVPLFLSFWLFHKPRSRSLRWGVPLLLGLTFLFGVQRYNFVNFANAIRTLANTYLSLDAIYLVAIVFITVLLMFADIWLWRGSRSFVWWIGFLVFITFLPNAPYVLTDIIHLFKDIRRNDSNWVITLVIIPQYLLFMLVGFEAYVLSLMYLGNYLRQHQLSKWILPTELIVHGLSAIGVYLGRFQRFNSWHIITQPDIIIDSIVNDLTRKFPVLIIAITFVVITVLYWIMKQLTLGIMLKRSSAIAPDLDSGMLPPVSSINQGNRKESEE